MRILLLAPYPPAVDGIGVYAGELADGLRAAGHEVGVITPRPLAGDPPEVIGAVPASPRSIGPLVGAVATFEPDIVHVQFAVATWGQRAPSLFALIRRLRREGRPIVVTFHEITRDTARLRAAGRRLYRSLAAHADALVVHTAPALRVTEGVAAGAPVDLIAIHEARPPDATTTAAALRERYGLDDCFVLLAFGFVHVDKGLDDLVAALAEVFDRNPGRRADVRLAVAGDVRTRRGLFRVFEWRDRVHLARVRRAIARSHLADHVVFAGYVPAGEIRTWFELADAAVMPYRRIEQSAVASLALAVGATVLPSTVGGLVELFPDSPWTFAPGDRRELADVLVRFVNSSAAERAAGTPRREGRGLADVVERLSAVYEAARRPHEIDEKGGSTCPA